MGEHAIEVKTLDKTYRDGFFGRRRVLALRDVSFAVKQGTIFGLLGPNGAGKTTLIKVLLGLVKKSGGSAQLLGYPAGHRAGRRRVGYLPEHHRIPRHLTGNGALIYYGGLSGMSPNQVRQQRGPLLERVGLAAWGRTSVRKYSKGMLQRLGLAQAMLHDPDLLILDEPTDGVDPVGRTEMRAVLQQLKQQGKTVFINSHLLQEVELVCDQVAILVQGQVQKVGTVSDIRRTSNEVSFSVRGAGEVVAQAVKEAAISVADWSANGDQVTFTFAADQQDVNQCIDRLRAHDIDIAAISPHQESLESAFLNIVKQSQ